MAAEKALEFFAGEPLLPLGRYQLAPVLCVLIDDRDPAAGLYYAANFTHCFFDLYSVLQRLGGIGSVERLRFERELRHRPGARMDAFGNEAEHLLGDVETPQLGLGLLFVKDAGEPAFATADVENPFAGEIAQVLADQLDWIN